MIAVSAEGYLADGHYEHDALYSAMAKCPICGDSRCTKEIVEANNVWVHPEDVQDADNRDNPQLQEK